MSESPTQRTIQKTLIRGRWAHSYISRCDWCGAEFHPCRRSQKFCSRQCAVNGRNGPTRRNKVIKKCKKCGEKYEVQNKLIETTTYCSRECLYADRNYNGKNNPKWRGGGMRKCETCGKIYKSYAKNRRYCGIKCGNIEQSSEAMRNQRRGYEAELKCCQELSECGYAVARSAASKGPYDVYAIASWGVILIQVKRTKANARRRHPPALKELWDAPPGPPSIIRRKQLWCWVDNKGWFIITLLPDGGTHETWL